MAIYIPFGVILIALGIGVLHLLDSVDYYRIPKDEQSIEVLKEKEKQ